MHPLLGSIESLLLHSVDLELLLILVAFTQVFHRNTFVLGIKR